MTVTDEELNEALKNAEFRAAYDELLSNYEYDGMPTALKVLWAIAIGIVVGSALYLLGWAILAVSQLFVGSL